MTGLAAKELGIKAVKAGAQDFLVKGDFDSDQLSKTLRYSIERNNVLKRLEEAQRIASTHTYWKLQSFTKPNRDPLQSPEVLKPIIECLGTRDASYYKETMDTMILGTEEECKEQIETLVKYYDVDEVMIVNVTYSFEDRKNSYERLANVFNLINKE